jgi:hypothetical protein
MSHPDIPPKEVLCYCVDGDASGYPVKAKDDLVKNFHQGLESRQLLAGRNNLLDTSLFVSLYLGAGLDSLDGHVTDPSKRLRERRSFLFFFLLHEFH